MDKALKEKILYWLRHASNEGRNGFFWDMQEDEPVSEDWTEFEVMAIGDIEQFLDTTGKDC